MAKQSTKPIDRRAETAARVRAALASRRGVVEKPMMGAIAFMVKGTMCCAVNADNILFRVHPDDREALLARAHVMPMDMGERTMRGFVRVAPAGYRSDANLAAWLERGIAAGAKRQVRPRS